MDALTRIRDEIALAGSKPVNVRVTPAVYERLLQDILRFAQLEDQEVAEPLLFLILDCNVDQGEGPDVLISFRDCPDVAVDLG